MIDPRSRYFRSAVQTQLEVRSAVGSIRGVTRWNDTLVMKDAAASKASVECYEKIPPSDILAEVEGGVFFHGGMLAASKHDPRNHCFLLEIVHNGSQIRKIFACSAQISVDLQEIEEDIFHSIPLMELGIAGHSRKPRDHRIKLPELILEQNPSISLASLADYLREYCSDAGKPDM